MVNVPDRAAPAFGSVLNWTVPLPLSFDPEVTVIHAALLAAVHAQPAGAVTATAGPGPPAAATAAFAGLIAYAQPVA